LAEIMTDLQKTKVVVQNDLTPAMNVQVAASNAKIGIMQKADQVFAQIDGMPNMNIGVPAAELEARSQKQASQLDSLQQEIEQVYNFERDVATAKVQDKDYDKKVAQVDGYMANYRFTYKDPEYLRAPAKNEFEAAARREDDKKRRNFEAHKQVLDDEKTQYGIMQAMAVAAAAEAGAPK
tara:strand:+ start:164 stop:703 length:540 start_codon:yes stop_codon:yes gene_type:complete